MASWPTRKALWPCESDEGLGSNVGRGIVSSWIGTSRGYFDNEKNFGIRDGWSSSALERSASETSVFGCSDSSGDWQSNGKLSSLSSHSLSDPEPVNGSLGNSPAFPKPFLADAPKVCVMPFQKFGFTNQRIQLIIKPTNFPRISMVLGTVIAPNGQTLPCHIYKSGNYYTAEFKATDVLGAYLLHVRVIFSVNGFQMNQEAISSVVIHRNYSRSSKNEVGTSSIKLDFVPYKYQPVDGEKSRPEAKRTTAKSWGIAYNKFNNKMYYTDRTGGFFSCLDPETGKEIFKCGSSERFEFNRPTGICCDERNRRILVVDKDNHRILAFSFDGQLLSTLGKRGFYNGQFEYPWSVDVNENGDRMVVSDSRNKRIQVFDQHGIFQGKFSVFEKTPHEFKGNFDEPRGVTFNNDGTSSIFVSDFKSDHIVEVSGNLEEYWKICKINRPQGLVLDESGQLLVAGGKLVSVFSRSENRIVSKITSVGNDELEFPVNLTLLDHGKVAVLDASEQSIVRIF